MQKEDFKQLVQMAREADLLSYFRESGYQIDQRGDNYYIKDFPGLCIRPDKNQWYNHYTNTGRTNNSIDCLTLILNKDFNQAVYELTGRDVSLSRSTDFPKKEKPQFTSPPKQNYEPKEKKELVMPPPSANMRNIFAYLCQSRKIPASIIEELVHAKLLYKTVNEVSVNVNGVQQHFKNANAVFVHKDEKGNVIGGEVQGCNSFKRFKGVVGGTGESAFMYQPYPTKDGKPKKAYIFESSIDLLSFYTFCKKEKMQGVLLVSMAGLKPSIPKRLEAEGVTIISCVDNDYKGRLFEAANGFNRPESVKELLDEKGFKDWNELLVFKSASSNANISEKSTKLENTRQPIFNALGGRR